MGASILVVDDERGILDVLEFELRHLGHDVTVAANGSKGIEELRRTEFDVVISDVRMPGASGLEVLRATKELWPETEVLITTGYAELEAAVACVRGGAFDFVHKPFDVDSLLAIVARALERRQLRASTALYRASQAILATEDPHRLPGVIVEVAMKVMAADDVSLMLAGVDDTLYIAEARGLALELRSEVLALGARVAGRVATSREPALIQNGLATDPRFSDVPSFRRVRSSIVYPLAVRERLVGILNINRVGDPRPFRQQDLHRASVLASQVLLALENRRLLESVAGSERLAAIGQLAAGVAHEINNPAACVIAGSAFLRDQLAKIARGELGGKALIEETLQALEDVAEGATRIGDLARDVRSLARNDEETSAVVDLNEALRSALRVAGAEIRPHATVVTRLGKDVEVLGSAGRLSQVFVNLLVNAAHAVAGQPGTGHEIIVTSHRQGNRVVAEVSDTGPGVRPEHLPRVFEAFFTTKGPTTGMGLGLSISRDIVRRLGGELRVTSPPGRGATFSIDLPAAPDEGGDADAHTL